MGNKSAKDKEIQDLSSFVSEIQNSTEFSVCLAPYHRDTGQY